MHAPVTRIDNDCYLINAPYLQIETDTLNAQLDETETNRSDELHKAQFNAGAGRAPVRQVRLGNATGILRHYCRGGLMAKVSADRFLWTGINRTRSIREFRLLEWMTEKALPVPEPLAARVQRSGFCYHCDIVTREITATRTLAMCLQQDKLCDNQWSSVGLAIHQLHNENVFHADLNANNILISEDQTVTIIDFDKCYVRNGNKWKQNNIARLERSLNKLTHKGQIKHFTDAGWQALRIGYER